VQRDGNIVVCLAVSKKEVEHGLQLLL